MSDHIKSIIIATIVVAIGPSIIGALFAAFVNMDTMWFNPSNWEKGIRVVSGAWFFIAIIFGFITAMTA